MANHWFASRSVIVIPRSHVIKDSENYLYGNLEKLRSQLEQLQNQYKADEMMMVTITHRDEDRARSYERIAEAFSNEKR
jgi:hypothetical protein